MMTTAEQEHQRCTLALGCLPLFSATEIQPAFAAALLGPLCIHVSRPALPAPTERVVGRYRGIDIWISEDGYHASASCAEHFGYADTVEEIRGDIDYWHGDDRDIPLDTPSLDDSLHQIEMQA